MHDSFQQYRYSTWVSRMKALIEQLTPIQLEKNAHYSISSTRIVFNFDDPANFSIPYNLDDESFQKYLPEIDKAMIWFHELTHYIQSWSTTNGILESMALLYKYDQIVGILKKNFEYKLPLLQYYQELYQKFPYLQENEIPFFSIFLGYLAHELNYSWLTGALNPDILKINNSQPFDQEGDDFFVRNLAFSNMKEIDRGYGFENKPTSVFLCRTFSPDAYYTIGTMHLMECFAKTVEFEHLLKFNKKYGEKYILSWLFERENSTYNLPVHLWEYNLKKAKNKREITFTWAHLRVFIDIAMMYSDFLDTDYPNFSDGKISDRVVNLKVQPGIIFNRVLQVFQECDPLIDHDQDILRLYDEICNKLGLPSIKIMIEKIIKIIQSLNNQDFIKQSLAGASFLGVAEKLLIMKYNDPVLFINDLIYPPRFKEITDAVKDHLAIYTPNGWKERNDVTTLEMDMVSELNKQLLTKSSVMCPRFIVINRLMNTNEQIIDCNGVNSGGKYCKECGFGSFVEVWLKNERRIK